MAETRRLELPDENTLRLQAWATAETRGTFHDPLRPDAELAATVGLALRSLAQEVLMLRTRVALLEKRLEPREPRPPVQVNLMGLSWEQASLRMQEAVNEALAQLYDR